MTAQAYYNLDTGEVLLTDQVTCWDATIATNFTGLLTLLNDLAADDPQTWPLESSPWTDHTQAVREGRTFLIVDIRDPGEDTEALTFYNRKPEEGFFPADLLLSQGAFPSRNWKRKVQYMNQVDQLLQHVRANPTPPPHTNPRGSMSHYGRITEAEPAAQGVWRIRTEHDQQGFILDLETWTMLPWAIQAAMRKPRYAVGELEYPIMATLLGLEDPRTLNQALSATKQYRRYERAALAVICTFPSGVHYHGTEGHEDGRQDTVMTFKNHLDAMAFASGAEVAAGYRNPGYFQCCGEECANLEHPPLMPLYP